MISPAAQFTEHEFEQRIGTLLRVGVSTAAVVVLIGAILYLLRHGQETPAYHSFHSEPSSLRTLPGIFSVAWHLQGRGIIQLGLVLLIATPIARVAFAGVGFARQRDWLYVGISCIVLALLCYGLLTIS